MAGVAGRHFEFVFLKIYNHAEMNTYQLWSQIRYSTNSYAHKDCCEDFAQTEV